MYFNDLENLASGTWGKDVRLVRGSRPCFEEVPSGHRGIVRQVGSLFIHRPILPARPASEGIDARWIRVSAPWILVSIHHHRFSVSKPAWTYTCSMDDGGQLAAKQDLDDASNVFGTLNKSVMALAIQPLNTALTLTGRKVYDVMLHIAQTNPAGEEGGWSYPVTGIMHGYGSRTKASERIQRYIELMAQTVVVYRPLTASDSLMIEGVDPGGTRPTDEARTFALLSEARLYRRGREWWVTWFFPPTIREQLLNPGRWAQIELASVARLSTYTALALYEITARYKESPAGLTSRQSPDFWMEVLREGGELKKREWRKFKHELLAPAIQEINNVTEINVELVEHRTRGVVDAVQFKVTRRQSESVNTRETVDVSLVVQATRLGIKEHEFDTLAAKYGEAKLGEAMTAMEAYAYNPKQKIMNPALYLKTVLTNRDKEQESQASLFNEGSATTAPADILQAQEKVEALARDELVQAWKVARTKSIRVEFGNLTKEQRDYWVEIATPEILQKLQGSMFIKKRLAAKEWESPLISQYVLGCYAKSKHGDQWLTPSEIDLTLFEVERSARVERSGGREPQ